MNERDKMLSMVLPTLVVLAIYFLFFLRPANRELSETQSRWNSAKTSQVSTQQLLDARAREAALRTELKSLTEQSAKEKQGLEDLAKTLSLLPDQAERAQRITELLKSNGLHVVESKFTDQTGDIALSRPITQVVGRLKERTSLNISPARVWQVRMVGNFGQAQATLDQLCGSDQYGIPIGLAMGETLEDTDLHIWTLTIWI